MKYVGIILVILIIGGIIWWLNSGGYYTDQPKEKKEGKAYFEFFGGLSWKEIWKTIKFIIVGVFVGSILFLYPLWLVKEHDDELKAKKVWVNKEHTACHFQDTIEVNGVKYLKVWDRENSNFYGDPYLVPVTENK